MIMFPFLGISIICTIMLMQINQAYQLIDGADINRLWLDIVQRKGKEDKGIVRINKVKKQCNEA